MTTEQRIDALRIAAGQAGDDAQVALCDAALTGDADAIAECLRVCREAEIDRLDVREWARLARRGPGRRAAVLAARLARKRFDDVSKSIEANRWPKMILTMGTILETVEHLLASPEAN